MARSAFPKSAVVLVVEDEALLRLHAIDMIEAAGYITIEARNADEAVAILKERTDIRVVFTDIDMPGSMDGMKLAAMVRDRWPPIEIIMTSGFTRPQPSDMPLRSLFFAKPYDDGKVIGAIQAFVG